MQLSVELGGPGRQSRTYAAVAGDAGQVAGWVVGVAQTLQAAGGLAREPVVVVKAAAGGEVVAEAEPGQRRNGRWPTLPAKGVVAVLTVVGHRADAPGRVA